MKNVTFIALALLVSSPSYAQFEESRQTRTSSPSMIGGGDVSGVQVSLFKPVLDIELEVGSRKIQADMEDTLGFGIGYKNIGPGRLGFIGGGSFISGDVENTSATYSFLRFDGNAAYGINDLIHVYGGLNLSKLVDGPGDAEDAIDEMGLGLQIGTGIQITENFSVDLKYITMKEEGDINDTNADLSQEGFEFGVSATF